MRIGQSGLIVAGLLLAGSPEAAAQQATERFIPVGYSPGLSHTYTVVGEVQASDGNTVTLSVEGADRTYVIGIDSDTKIWLDRSQLQRTTLYGGQTDLIAGRMIEVKFRDYERRDRAQWIKVVIPPGS